MRSHNPFFPKRLIGQDVVDIINEVNSRNDYFLRADTLYDDNSNICKTVLRVYQNELTVWPLEKVLVASLYDYDLTGVTGELEVSFHKVVLLDVDLY